MVYWPYTTPLRTLLLKYSAFPLIIFAGPVSSILVNRYGCRTVVIIGGLMVGASMVAASFGTTIIHLYLLVGVIGGIYLNVFLKCCHYYENV